MLIQWQKDKRFYEGFLADECHNSVKMLKQFKGRYCQFDLGLMLDGDSIGRGSLKRWTGACRKDYLQTESTQLNRGERNKGHGIVLYIFLIEAARVLGAKRIYSSRNLNRHSRRMWHEKLPKIYNVQRLPGRCRCCGRPFKHSRKPVYFIDLQKESAVNLKVK